MLGMISFCANSSAVCAISECCSLKSSGVNTSSGCRESNRKLPPGAVSLGAAVVAMATPSSTTEDADDEPRVGNHYRPGLGDTIPHPQDESTEPHRAMKSSGSPLLRYHGQLCFPGARIGSLRPTASPKQSSRC